MLFRTELGVEVPAVSADQMREVDRVAVEEFGLGVLQMMENAGRSLASCARDMLPGAGGRVVVVAGSGGNGGGGLCCARHLLNHGVEVDVVLDRDASELRGAAATQHRTMVRSGLSATIGERAAQVIGEAALIVDALIGYGLEGPPRDRAEELIVLANASAAPVLALDVPSGVNATTGETAGAAIEPTRTLTLALPKTGLADIAGELCIADIGIPLQVYERIGVAVTPFFSGDYLVRLSSPGG